MTKRIVLLLISALCGCAGPPDPAKTDIGPSLHRMGKESSWNCKSITLGKTGYTASVGYVKYANPGDGPDYYSVDVEQSSYNGNSYVYFERDIKLIDLPVDFHDTPESIVLFDQTSRTVKFHIGNFDAQYVLP